MTWRALVADPDGRIRQTIAEIVAACDGAPAADLAVLRSYVAADGAVPDPDDAATRALERAVRELPDAPHLGLHGGATRTGWTIAHLAGGDIADQACRELDDAIAGALAGWAGDFDLISGVVGLGVYALERNHGALARAIVDHLEQRARPYGGGRAWHSGPELLSRHELSLAPDGYWNLGLAHGTPGVIALLARFAAHGFERARCLALIDDAAVFLRAAAPALGEAGGRFSSWLPASAPASPRLAWCYGDLGVATALAGAGVHAGRDELRDEGLALARACAARTLDQAQILDAAICHGAAGIAHQLFRLARASADATLISGAKIWLDRVLAMRGVAPIAGYPRVDPDGAGGWRTIEDGTLLSGATGVALVLHAAISDVEPSWDRLLLCDLPASG